MQEIASYKRRVFLKDHPVVTQRIVLSSAGTAQTLLAGTVIAAKTVTATSATTVGALCQARGRRNRRPDRRAGRRRRHPRRGRRLRARLCPRRRHRLRAYLGRRRFSRRSAGGPHRTSQGRRLRRRCIRRNQWPTSTTSIPASSPASSTGARSNTIFSAICSAVSPPRPPSCSSCTSFPEASPCSPPSPTPPGAPCAAGAKARRSRSRPRASVRNASSEPPIFSSTPEARRPTTST